MLDLFEKEAVERSEIHHGIIRRWRDEDGNMTSKLNLREWEGMYFVDFPSEATRDAWFKEICYTFAAIGFWKSNRLDYFDIKNDEQPGHTDDEFEQARRQYESDMAELKVIGQPAYLAKLDREFAASFGVTV